MSRDYSKTAIYKITDITNPDFLYILWSTSTNLSTNFNNIFNKYFYKSQFCYKNFKEYIHSKPCKFVITKIKNYPSHSKAHVEFEIDRLYEEEIKKNNITNMKLINYFRGIKKIFKKNT
jgi:hypothetical protein